VAINRVVVTHNSTMTSILVQTLHYWADLQSVHGLRCYGNIARTLVTSLRPSRDMTT